MGMGGMGMGGMGMGMGGYGQGLMGMGMGGAGSGSGAISSLNQFLFSFQSIIFSLGQAMQIVTMNTNQLHLLYDQIMAMIDHALQYIHQLQHLDQLQSQQTTPLTEEQIKQKRRLKAIRWSLMLGISYGGFKIVLKWYRKRKGYAKARAFARNRIAPLASPSALPSALPSQGQLQLQQVPQGHNPTASYSHPYGNNDQNYGAGNGHGHGYGRTTRSANHMDGNGYNSHSNSGYYNPQQQHHPQQNDYYSSYTNPSTYQLQSGYPSSGYSPF
mmetsp:Transcript_25500/g.37818  ORF Transcript_25500/g.37818 Transcript_25500/m.37818 type:complete len:271 (+) Transcript_25500:1-813(+)